MRRRGQTDGDVGTGSGARARNRRARPKVHVGLHIAAEQWDTFMGVIRQALEERGVAEADQRDFLTLFERYRAETVGL